jgi:hypothetical protein
VQLEAPAVVEESSQAAQEKANEDLFKEAAESDAKKDAAKAAGAVKK